MQIEKCKVQSAKRRTGFPVLHFAAYNTDFAFCSDRFA
jgi:hypothetical protein